MFSTHLEEQIVYENDPVCEAFWSLTFGPDPFLLVVDNEQKFLGVCGMTEFKKNEHFLIGDVKKIKIKDIYNNQPRLCVSPPPDSYSSLESHINWKNKLYQQASYLFSRYPGINKLPIIDEDRNIIDIIKYEQVFWSHLYIWK